MQVITIENLLACNGIAAIAAVENHFGLNALC